jgi:hypothetical protein
MVGPMRRVVVAILGLLALVARDVAADDVGLPNPDHIWSNRELTAAAAFLASRPGRLPVYPSAVFARLVEALPDRPDATPEQLIPTHMERYDSLKAIAKLYMTPIPRRESIELLGALLREAVVLEGALAPFLASLGPNDPQRDVRMEGLKKWHVGTTGMAMGALLVADDRRVPREDRRAMVSYLRRALPALYPGFPATDQQWIRRQLAALIAAVGPGPLYEELVAAQRALP